MAKSSPNRWKPWTYKSEKFSEPPSGMKPDDHAKSQIIKNGEQPQTGS